MRWFDRDEAFDDIADGTRVVAGNACGTPTTLLAGIAAQAERVGSITLTCGLLLGEIPLESAVRSGALQVRSWHVHGALRQLYREGLIDYLPIRLLDIPDVVLRESDVALIRVGPADHDGYCSIGPSASFTIDAIDRARLVIAEVSEDMPRTHGDSAVHISRIDRFVRSEYPLPEHPQATPDAVATAIAQNVLSILPEGATLQLGIGAVPEALASAIARDGAPASFGLIGLVTDAMIPLVEQIAARTGVPVRAVELMGTAAFMRWAHNNAALEMRSSQHVHNPVELSAIPRLVSVNSAVAVDVRGQVIAESVRGSVIAGVGGSADFSEGAHLSAGGLRIIALASTTRSGATTIVAAHDRADTVTAPHHSVDAVVTEYGVAWLRGRTRRERAHALTGIAGPDHRDSLSTLVIH